MTDVAAPLSPEVVRLLAEANEWHLIATLFESPHASSGAGSPSWRARVNALAARVPDPTLRSAADAAGREAAENLYLALFGPGGAVSPRQAGYCLFTDPGRTLALLTASYDAFAYRPRVAEPADHVAVIAGFVAYLRMKEAFARANDLDDAAGVAARTAEIVERDHLAEFAGKLAERLRAVGVEYLSGAAAALAERVTG